MNKTSRNSAAAVLLLAGAVLIWTGTEANAQAGFRRGQGGFRTRATSNSTTGTTTGTTGTTTAGSTTSGTMCPANGSGATSTATGSTTSGATILQTSTAAASRSAQSLASTQSSGGLSAQIVSSGQVLVQWAGSTSSVQSVTFGVFAANGRMLDSQVVTQAPARATLSLNSAASSYGMRVTYANGTSSTVYRPLR